MGITLEQHNTLMKGITGNRVARRKGSGGMTLSYLEAYDVRAHLTRMFGFCNWSATVTDVTLTFEEQEQNEKKRWNVGYLVTLRLSINDPQGQHLCDYTEAAVGSATLPSRGEAHDMAVKTAESDALKRAAVNLGDQFGLSLYNNGSTAPVMKMTVVIPQAPQEPQEGPSGASAAEPRVQPSPEPSEAVKAAVSDLVDASLIVESEQRILAVASAKTKHADTLEQQWVADGKTVTIGRLADMIAAGSYPQMSYPQTGDA